MKRTNTISPLFPSSWTTSSLPSHWVETLCLHKGPETIDLMAGSLARGLPLLVFVIEHNKQRINTARWEIWQRNIQTISFLRQVEVFLISEYLTTAQTVKQQANIKANTSVIVLQPLLTCQTEIDIAITLMFLFCLWNVMKNTTKQWKLWIMWQNCCRQTRIWGGWVSRGGCQPPPARGMALARPPSVPCSCVAPRDILLSKKTFRLVSLSLSFVFLAINHYIINNHARQCGVDCCTIGAVFVTFPIVSY